MDEQNNFDGIKDNCRNAIIERSIVKKDDESKMMSLLNECKALEKINVLLFHKMADFLDNIVSKKINHKKDSRKHICP